MSAKGKAKPTQTDLSSEKRLRDLMEMVGNLIENAFKYCRSKIAVSAQPGALVRLLIDDDGPGVPESDREAIFRRFWRRDRNQQGSSGLGLSIVQRIAELHGATIEVENRVMGGAQFSLHFIPAAVPPEA